MNIIDYGYLETAINKVEESMTGYDLEEQQLILKQVTARIGQKIRDVRVKDTVNNISYTDIVNKLMKGGTNK